MGNVINLAAYVERRRVHIEPPASWRVRILPPLVPYFLWQLYPHIGEKAVAASMGWGWYVVTFEDSSTQVYHWLQLEFLT